MACYPFPNDSESQEKGFTLRINFKETFPPRPWTREEGDEFLRQAQVKNIKLIDLSKLDTDN